MERIVTIPLAEADHLTLLGRARPVIITAPAESDAAAVDQLRMLGAAAHGLADVAAEVDEGDTGLQWWLDHGRLGFEEWRGRLGAFADLLPAVPDRGRDRSHQGLVTEIGFSDGMPWVRLDLADGDEQSVMAIQRADGHRSVEEAQRLADLIAAHQR